MSVDTKTLSVKLKISFGSGKGSYTISNISEAATPNALFTVGQKLNLLQVPNYDEIYMISESELTMN